MNPNQHPFRLARTFLPASTLLIGLALSPVSAQDRRPVLKALEAKGVTVVGTFPAAGGLTAWAGFRGQQTIALYATPDGKHLIAGTLLDDRGNDVNQEALKKAVTKPMADAVWGQVEKSHWIADGSSKAPRIVYVLTDPNCPYCNKLWSDARPWINAGKVQLRHIMVGILTPTSAGKAAALLTNKNPAAALAAHEQANTTANAKVMTAGQPKPLDNGIKPLGKIPAAAQAQLDANEQLMESLQLRATPALIWRDDKGEVQTRTGAPDGVLAAAFGPL